MSLNNFDVTILILFLLKNIFISIEVKDKKFLERCGLRVN